MITVERVSRILDQFNISFTEGAVLSSLQRGLLQKAPRFESGYYSRNTKYGFSVDRESLVKYLIGQGITEERINEALLPA